MSNKNKLEALREASRNSRNSTNDRRDKRLFEREDTEREGKLLEPG
ncbi:hypothetical protein WN51_09601 [Melipona quadrifasciata]|uniref:Uncharacterized protein n=1 Tax=Melipona quadrifasciata TaxID=166423 RepID=A0A0N0BIV9_9HYME|nr:hypothetical protein WN51_09601 [Melipona quadrifasciata]